MISLPKRFAGFSSAQAVLNDASLSADQKRTALLTWQAALKQAANLSAGDRNDANRIIREIDVALESLDRQRRGQSGRQ
ncbi:hypothetical protein [Roseibium marinum]|uniref:Uncharacterized protein n=1 Tax=Roseibium marinum TaxID=281252 RepID=A0A2S3UL38_9HYPH|nr:hypothetical protein [Roseibium marinum]POF28424.1 hypothetical protein CLV41_11495 [Roseibium marinum]